MIDKNYRKLLSSYIPEGLSYEFENGKRHTILRINGRLAATISGRSKTDRGRGMINVICCIKRVVREIQLSELCCAGQANPSVHSGHGNHA